MKLDDRLLVGLTVTPEDLISVVRDHYSGPAGDKPCKRCKVPLCPSYRTAQPLAHERRNLVDVDRLPDWLWAALQRPVGPPPRRRVRSRKQAEEMFDSAPFVDHSKARQTARRRAAS